jgi:hypothetical protein
MKVAPFIGQEFAPGYLAVTLPTEQATIWVRYSSVFAAALASTAATTTAATTAFEATAFDFVAFGFTTLDGLATFDGFAALNTFAALDGLAALDTFAALNAFAARNGFAVLLLKLGVLELLLAMSGIKLPVIFASESALVKSVVEHVIDVDRRG